VAREPDNRILECALAGKAEAIVTDDKKLLALTSSRSIPVLSLASCLSTRLD
jgi:predicted nucleic acid-binding protein